MARTKRRSRRLKLFYALFILFVVGLIALIMTAHMLPKTDNSAEIQTILREAKEDQAKRAEAAAVARRAMPKDAVIPTDWDFRALASVIEGKKIDPLVNLVTCCILNADNVSKEEVERIRQVMAKSGSLPAGNPFNFAFTPESIGRPELRARLSAFLRECKPLQEFETAHKLGILQDFADAYRSPSDSNLLSLCHLIAGRGLFELEAGETARALDTILTCYEIAGIFEDWPHFYGARGRFFADSMTHNVLWNFVDSTPVGSVDQQRIINALNALKPVDRMAKALLVQGVNIETGEEAEYWGHSPLMVYTFSIAGRESLDKAKRLVSILDMPPYQARQQLAELDKPIVGGIKVKEFTENAIISYRLHARDAIVSDIARLSFLLKDWRREHGTYPTSLQELQPFPLVEIPREPMTGEPIKYETTGNSFTLQSYPSGTFDGVFYWIARK